MIVSMSNAGTIVESRWARAALDPWKWTSSFFPLFFPWLSSNCIWIAVSISESTHWASEQRAAEIDWADACFGAFPVLSKQTLRNGYWWIWTTNSLAIFTAEHIKLIEFIQKSCSICRLRREAAARRFIWPLSIILY